MIRSSQTKRKGGARSRSVRGFSLVELCIVMAIASLLAAFAIPIIGNTLRVYKMRSAVTSVTGVISSTRYQAIFHGCKAQVVFTASTYSYQVQSEAPAFGGQVCANAFTDVGTAVPLMGAGIALNQNVTLTFTPGGGVGSNPAMTPIQLTLSYPGFTSTVPSEQITVSNYGNITVTP
ncbi:MAG: prepilin-type N-terminal cleavage/methylation domain-containing protein [Candidatus Acidiferrum sp.]